jgi:hypothetical protein
VLAAEPSLAQLTGQQMGGFWVSAKQRFSKAASSAKPERAGLVTVVEEQGMELHN